VPIYFCIFRFNWFNQSKMHIWFKICHLLQFIVHFSYFMQVLPLRFFQMYPKEKLIWLSTTGKWSQVVAMNKPSGLSVVYLKSSMWFLWQPEVSWEPRGPEPQNICYFVEHRRRSLITLGQAAVRSLSLYSCCDTGYCHVGGHRVHQE